jgi:glycosyltransferase involved in cell wall biosynthesis
MPEAPVISVVIPCYNERDNLLPLVASISEALDPLKLDYEIIITDDCSRDDSWPVLQKLAAENPRVRAQRLAKNSGQSAALWAGIQAASGRYIATLDADMQNDPRDLPKFVEAMKNADCVCGSRLEKRKDGDNFIRQISSKIANGVRNWITHETVTDSGCCYRMFKRECAANLKFFKGMHRFLPTLFKIEGFTVTEIPVNHQTRLSGESKYGVWNRLFASSYDLFAVRWMQKRMFRFQVGERANFPPEKK